MNSLKLVITERFLKPYIQCKTTLANRGFASSELKCETQW